MIWSFAEKNDEEKVSSNASVMETATINSSSNCENAKSEKQSMCTHQYCMNCTLCNNKIMLSIKSPVTTKHNFKHPLGVAIIM